MITPADKGRIAHLIASETYRTLLSVAQEMFDAWYKDVPCGDNEFEYVKNCLLKDGKIQGVDNFLKRLEAIASAK